MAPTDKPGIEEELVQLAGRAFYSTESLLKSDILEVLKTASVRPAKILKKNQGVSLAGQRVKDALQQEPNNIQLICKLGFIYAAEGKWCMAMNVLLRGWKRVGEFKGEQLRVQYLLKLCQASHREGKFRQAQAVLMDVGSIVEASDVLGCEEYLSYLILACQVSASSKDIPQALKFFNKAVAGRGLRLAARILALVSEPLLAAGAYDAARGIVEAIAEQESDSRFPPGYVHPDLTTLDAFAQARKAAREQASRSWVQRQLDRPQTELVPLGLLGATGVLILSMLCYGLYWLEQQSLERLAVGG
eukprot:TRINITY_DN34234_c0_g1_i1.p1 TRINITY_DN34234_c0_g1~~TRINITY_DN34234_c0_g1_i1.p1  ORF type:complete len:303 (+),score=84.17 TRINITY_DN34234_c0_g1_i1:122-1030(+)